MKSCIQNWKRNFGILFLICLYLGNKCFLASAIIITRFLTARPLLQFILNWQVEKWETTSLKSAILQETVSRAGGREDGKLLMADQMTPPSVTRSTRHSGRCSAGLSTCIHHAPWLWSRRDKRLIFRSVRYLWSVAPACPRGEDAVYHVYCTITHLPDIYTLCPAQRLIIIPDNNEDFRQLWG